MKRLAFLAWGMAALACEASAAQPVAQFSTDPTTPPSGCAPLDVQFRNQSTGSEFLTYLWDFGDGGMSTAYEPLHRYEVPAAYPAKYTVTLVVTDPFFENRSDTATQPDLIELIPPRAAFTTDVTCGCAPLTVQFSDQSTGVIISSWLWKFGDGATSNQQNPSHEYANPGTYTVELTVTDSCGGTDVATGATPISVIAPPTVDFTGTPTTGCAPLEVDFTRAAAGGGITATLWDFGDGGTSTDASPTHTYASPGKYTVKLTLTKQGCCSKTTTKADYITAISPPTVNFVADSVTGCPPHTVSFTNQSSDLVTDLEWDFGDGSTSTDENPTHVYENPGSYTVLLSGVGPCGPVSRTRRDYISVGTPPVADFAPSVTSGCAGLSVTFTDTSTGTGITEWAWDFGDGGTSAQQAPSHVFASPGTFTVTLAVKGACGTSLKQVPFQVLLPVTALFASNPATGCGPLQVQFTDQSTGEAITSWAWDFGDGSTSAEPSPLHVFEPPTSTAFRTYTVSLTVQNACNSDAETAQVTVYAPPVADFTASAETGCSPLTVQFTDNSTGADLTSWSWDFGDGLTSVQRSPSHVYQSPGTYTVKLTVQSFCGENAATKADFISVLTLPPAPGSIEYEPPGEAYLDDSLTVRWPASAGAETYIVEWTPAALVQWAQACEVEADPGATSFSCSAPLEKVGNFKFRVVARNACGSSPPLEGPTLAVLPPAYFAHWPIEDCKAEDVEKNHDGKKVGTVGCASDRFGARNSALRFITEGYVSGNSLPVWTEDFSLSAWVRPEVAPEGSPPSEGIFLEIFPDAGAGASAAPIRFFWSETTFTLTVTHTDAESPIASFNDVAPGSWHFLLVSRSGIALRAYLDGDEAEPQNTDAFQMGSSFVFGGSAAGASGFLGELDDIYYESRPRSASDAFDLMVIRPGGSAYLDPTVPSREFSVEPGGSFEALQLKLKTGTARAGALKLDGLALLVEDVPLQEGAEGRADASFDLFEELVLSLKPTCADDSSGLTRLGSFRLASESAAGGRFELVLEGTPPSFANRADVCMVVSGKLWPVAFPSNRKIRFVVKTPDDLEIVDSAGAGFVAGRRRLQGSGAEGNTVFLMNVPPAIFASVPDPEDTQQAVGEILNARLHDMALQAGPTESIRLEAITYHAVPKSTLDGLTNPVLYVVTGPGPDDLTELARGVVTGKEIRFEGLGEVIASDAPTGLVLKADISVLPPASGTAFVTPPARGPRTLSPLGTGIALAGLQLICILGFLLYARGRRLTLRPARVLAFWLFSSLAVIAHGCGPAAIGAGVAAAVLSGGGGGGGSGTPFFQVGILQDGDLSGVGTTSGAPAVFTPEGAEPLVGTAYEVRKK